MPKKIRYAYCEVCKNEVENASKKPLTSIQKTTWVIVGVATLGIGFIVMLIYHVFFRIKEYCPDCFTKLTYSDQPFEKPKKKREAMTPKERVLEKVEEEKGPEEEYIITESAKKKPTQKKPAEKKLKKKEKELKEEKRFCTFCGEELDEDYATCPFCKAALKF
ncbi:MAG: hypothetical protein ACFE9T_15020 [Promethearchaeota archaeon]